MKDYYDIYYLSNKFDFDGKVLTEVLKKTFVNRGHALQLNSLGRLWLLMMMKLWKRNGKPSAVRLILSHTIMGLYSRQ